MNDLNLPSFYLEWLAGLKKLVQRILGFELEMETLARNFSKAIPHCRLVLYAKKPPARLGGGRPRGLYWGRVTRTGVVIHLKGRLTNSMVWKIALRANLARLFRVFDRQRLYLTRNRSALVKARTDLRKVGAIHSRLPLPVPLSTFLWDIAPLTGRDWPMAQGLFNLAYEGEMLRLQMKRLVFNLRDRYPNSGIRLVLWNVGVWNRRLYFTSGRGTIVPWRLTRRLMRSVGMGNPMIESLVEYRSRAAALNRAMSLFRARAVRVQRILRRADLTVLPRRRSQQKRTAV